MRKTNVSTGYLDREERRRTAKERQEVASTRTPQERLAILDEKFGVGIGATKERAKLSALITPPKKKSKKGKKS